MKILSALVLYTCLLAGANLAGANLVATTVGALPARAEPAPADIEAARTLRAGDMKKLLFHDAPKEIPQIPFQSEDGGTATLADYRGKIVVVNFWATWCAPCRKEMPTLSDLQARLGGPGFQVLTIAIGRNPPPAMKAFFDEIGVDNLPLHRDPKMALSRAMGVLGLPVTVILDRQGREIARLTGDAQWNSDTALAIFRVLIGEARASSA